MMSMANAQSHQDDDARWLAVVGHERRADGLFVYAVSSTGVYCRPSCASRRPRRDRVAFFDSAADAARAGYRACRRCRPDEAMTADPWVEKVRRACVYLANVDGHVSLARLAARLGGSPYHLQRSFKRLVGVTPREYADACRLQNVKRRLRKGARVTAAMLDAGYGSSSRFYERAVPKLAMSPTTYRCGGAGMRLRYAIVGSPLGQLLVAATDRGVCAVSMGSSDSELERALAREYPAATLRRDAGGLARWTNRILGHLAARRPRLDLPLDVQATAFQWQVWTALAAIPYGETRSYAHVAASIGRPRAVRAVARACATNPVALVIPCHRVVPSAGGTGGYRWGRGRKEALLAAEHKIHGR
jgi:AraC family transcriptional regulator, regulatory protein of adaptative response / methylated-DNA-[protein]-cysteine methyltransferase